MPNSSISNSKITAKILFIRLAVLFICLIAIDFIVGTILIRVYPSVLRGQNVGLINSAIQDKSDVLILGSSRAIHSYDDKLLSSKLKTSVYNAGNDGRGILYARGILSLRIQKHIPKLVILEICSFSEMEHIRTRILNPYYGHNKILNSILAPKWQNKLLLSSRLYRFNGLILSMVKNFRKKRKRWGFMPLYGLIKKDKKKRSPIILTPQVKNFYHLFFKEIEEYGIKTVVINSPSYKDIKNNKLTKFVESLCKKKNIPFINFTVTNYPEFQKKTMFRDPTHMNNNGAKLFNKIILSKLKALLPALTSKP